MIKTRGLSRINLNVADIERSVRFYRELFGLEVLHSYEGPMGPHAWGRQVVLSTPGAEDLIALTHVAGDPVGPAGISHFGFNLVSDEDVDCAVAKAQEAGGALIRRGEPRSTEYWNGLRMCRILTATLSS
jgi:catechol 2,3-dioxygenase-like lactoylglutathione lyase family enzyme